ncbi:hypothetical protein QR680_015968 [Steinernema hermaphroditum]|uniref:Salivary lipocalin n=1 Tax=Steinernema hermaphroditum TaxID=289476 RepID=A0AA39H9K6_9BILA|nr:hypothetical protein QR680_015968 [Steinernema hermaphroditum]
MRALIATLCITLVIEATAPHHLRVRPWSKYKVMFKSRNSHTLQRDEQNFGGTQDQTTLYQRTIQDGTCLIQVPDTKMFLGFLQSFYTYDLKTRACIIIFGVTISSTAPNVFRNLKDCQTTCCPSSSCHEPKSSTKSGKF